MVPENTRLVKGQNLPHAAFSRPYSTENMSCLSARQDGTKERGRTVGAIAYSERPWMSLSMDYIVNLPKVENCRSIIVMVDRFSKYATFISAPHAIFAETTAKLFFKDIVKLWGIPLDIVSGRDTRFTRRFWAVLFELIGTQLKFSTSNHLQTDG